ncbi:MAG: PKD domain-containing protein [Sulfolobales archaeon]
MESKRHIYLSKEVKIIVVFLLFLVQLSNFIPARADISLDTFVSSFSPTNVNTEVKQYPFKGIAIKSDNSTKLYVLNMQSGLFYVYTFNGTWTLQQGYPIQVAPGDYSLKPLVFPPQTPGGSNLSVFLHTVNNKDTFPPNDSIDVVVEIYNGTPPFNIKWSQDGLIQQTGKNATYSFSKKGSYIISVTVTDSTGASASASITVYIQDTLAVTIIGPNNVSTNTPYIYTAVVDGGSGNYSYSWSTDHLVSSDNTTATYSWSIAGFYAVVCTVTDLTTKQQAVGQLVVNVLDTLTVNIIGPDLVFINTPTNYIAQAVGGSGDYTYTWDLSYLVSQNQNTSIYSWNKAGTYIITVYVLDNNTNVQTNASKVITVVDKMTVKITGPTAGFTNKQYEYTASVVGGSGQYSYTWSSAGLVGSSSFVAYYKFLSPGTQTITCTVKDLVTNDVAVGTLQVNIYNSLIINISGPSALNVYQSGSYTATVSGGSGNYIYAWSSQFLVDSSNNSATYEFTTMGTYIITLKVTDATTSLTDETTKTVTVYNLQVGILGKTSYMSWHQNGVITVMGLPQYYVAQVVGGSTHYSYSWSLVGSWWTLLASNNPFAFLTSITLNSPIEYSNILKVTVTDLNTQFSKTVWLNITVSSVLTTINGPDSLIVGQEGVYTGQISFAQEPTITAGFINNSQWSSTGLVSVLQASGWQVQAKYAFNTPGIYVISCIMTGTISNGGGSSQYPVQKTVCVIPQPNFDYTVTINNVPSAITIGDTITPTATVHITQGTYTGDYIVYWYMQSSNYNFWILVGITAIFGPSDTSAPLTYRVVMPFHYSVQLKAVVMPVDRSMQREAIKNISVNDPWDNLTFKIEDSAPPTAGLCDGGVRAVLNGGKAPYQVISLNGGCADKVFLTNYTPQSLPATFYASMYGNGNVGRAWAFAQDDVGHTASDYIEVRAVVPSNPAFSITGPGGLCLGQTGSYSLQVNGNTAYTYTVSWSGDGLISSSSSGASYVWYTSGQKTITANINVTYPSNVAGNYTASFAVNVNSTPQISLLSSTTAYVGTPYTATVDIKATEPYTATWSGTGLVSGSGNSATYLWNSPGSYTISVSVKDACNQTGNASFTIQVLSKESLSVQISGPTSVCKNQDYTYTASVSGGKSPYSYSWTGAKSTNGSSAVYSFTSSGQVSVTVTDSSSPPLSVTQTLGVSVSELTSVSISGPSTGNINQTLTFQAITNGGTSPFTYTWGGSGLVSANGSTATYKWSSAGTYTVSLTVRDSCGTEKTAQVNVSISSGSGGLSIQIQGVSTVCKNKDYTYSAIVTGGSGSYTYSWSSGGTPSSGSQSSYTAKFTSNTTLTVTVTDTQKNTNATASLEIAVISNVQVTLSGQSQGYTNTAYTFTANVSGGAEPYQYTWSSDGLVSATNNTATYSWNTTGTKTVSVSVTDSCGSTSSNQISFTVQQGIGPLSISVTAGSTTVVQGSQIPIFATASGGKTPYTSISWSGPSGQVETDLSAGTSTILIVFGQTGTYTISATVTDSLNNTASGSVTIQVVPNASWDAYISGPDTVKSKEVVQYTCNWTVSGGGSFQESDFTYSWSTGSTNKTTNTYFVNTGTTSVKRIITCTITNIKTNSSKTVSKEVTVVPELQVTLSGPTSVNKGDVKTYTATPVGGQGPYTYTWTITNASGSSSTNSCDVSFSNTGTATVSVQVKDSLNQTASDSLSVTVSNPPPSPLSIKISGPTQIKILNDTSLTTGNWSAVVSGGTSPYTIKWYLNGTYSATGDSYSYGTKTPVSISLKAEVTDSKNNTASDTITAIFYIPLSMIITSYPSGVAAGSQGYIHFTIYGGYGTITGSASLSFTPSVCSCAYLSNDRIGVDWTKTSSGFDGATILFSTTDQCASSNPWCLSSTMIAKVSLSVSDSLGETASASTGDITLYPPIFIFP